MSSLNKGAGKVEVHLKWDPSPVGERDSDLDIIAATYLAAAPHGEPAYLVHFGSRSPDGTITLNRDSLNGKGLGSDEIMTFELDRLSAEYGRVVVGAAIQQRAGRMVFADVANPAFRVMAGYTTLAGGTFSAVSGATAATVAEFVRDDSGAWVFHEYVRGFDATPDTFARTMGGALS